MAKVIISANKLYKAMISVSKVAKVIISTNKLDRAIISASKMAIIVISANKVAKVIISASKLAKVIITIKKLAFISASKTKVILKWALRIGKSMVTNLIINSRFSTLSQIMISNSIFIGRVLLTILFNWLRLGFYLCHP